MAYVSQEMKSARAPQIKALLKQYGLKGTLSVRDHMELVLTVSEGKIDFIENFNETNTRGHVIKDSIDVNPYFLDEQFSGDAKEFLTKAFDALRGEDYFNKSDVMTDYFNVSHYFDIRIGKWNKPYKLI
jgi:hypothetical protein